MDGERWEGRILELGGGKRKRHIQVDKRGRNLLVERREKRGATNRPPGRNHPKRIRRSCPVSTLQRREKGKIEEKGKNLIYLVMKLAHEQQQIVNGANGRLGKRSEDDEGKGGEGCIILPQGEQKEKRTNTSGQLG